MDKIEELLTRGVANIIPGKEVLRNKLASGKKLNVYLGIDPTAPKIHLGHAVPLRRLQKLAVLGHNVTLLIGDFTTLVGDTSDKESERPILTEQAIKKNFETYKKQAEKLVDFSKIHVAYNSDWLKKLTYQELLKLKQQFSVNDFISRELIRKRLDAGKRVRLDETEYPIMQGYDSYHLDTDIQLGATDQTFNMQAGRTLQRTLRQKESFIIANEYLTGTDGRKMSKSWGNAIWLDDTPEDIYAKVMAINDELIIQYYLLATNVSLTRVEEVKYALNNGEHPMPLKKELALQITQELTNTEDAKQAKESFEKRVQGGEKPDEMESHIITVRKTIAEILIETGLANSKGEARRLLEQGGVSLDEKKIIDGEDEAHEGILKVGKRKFVKLEFKR